MALEEDDDEDAGPGLRTFVILVASIAASAAIVIHSIRRAPAPEPSLPWQDEARREVQGIVENRFVDPVTPERAEDLFDAAMKGYVKDLDPFSRYFPAQERVALDEDMSGTFGGIGVRCDAVPAGLHVTAVLRGGPADVAGVGLGETIEKVAGVPLTGREFVAMIDLIRGSPGTPVELVTRPADGGEPRRVEVVRAKVEADTVPSVRTIDGAPPIGYLRLSQFSDTTGAEARDALRSLAAAAPAGIVLDLRRNLGGVVQAAVDAASLFLPPDTLVCIARSRDASREYRTSAKDGFEPLSLPLVVLVDETSASASEILAGALQDHGRAVLVGTRTYGKFLMQTVVPLAHRGAMLRLTTARYLTPRGRSDQRNSARGVEGGLMPDVYVPLASQKEDEAIRAEFDRQAGPAWKSIPSRPREADVPDRQLAAAVELLRGGAAPAEPVASRTN